MCEPLTIASLALTAGSVVANQIGASKVADAREEALSAERQRQQQYDAQADALNQQSQDRYQDFGQQQDDRSKALGDYFTQPAVQAGAPTGLSLPQVSGLAAAEEGKQRGKAAAFTTQQGDALGSLRAFGDLMGGIGREQARDAGYIGQIGGFKKWSSAVVPFELEAANRKGASAKMFGDLLGLAGAVTGAAALAGGPATGVQSIGGDYAKIAGDSFAKPGFSITRF